MFQEGQQIGIYTLIQRIGRGGFGEVWLAERRTALLTTKVAVKLPHDSLIDLETVRQEAVLWEKASGHPNVLPIIEANIYDGQVVIVSEFAPDGSLSDLLKIARKIAPEKAVEIAVGITAGLDFLHSRRIIHRDIKPQNILLQGETPRLADFGISHALQTSVASRSANIKGTFSYMSPETFDGKRNEQTDIWAVGVVLYQMLAGDLPFPQTDTTALFGAIVMREPEPLTEDIPARLKEIVARALAKLPENRYKTAREMREDLQKALVNLTHPTFAPTEVLSKKAIESTLDTIEADKSVVTKTPSPIISETQAAMTQPFVSPQTPNDASVITQLSVPGTEIAPENFEKTQTRKPLKPLIYIFLFIFLLIAVPFIGFYSFYFFIYLTTPKVKITERDSSLPPVANIKMIPCQNNRKWGFCDVNGKVYIEQKYEDAKPFVEGFALIRVANYWLGEKNGFIDTNGREIIFRDYTYLYPFSEGLAEVRKPGLNNSGFIDKNFQEVIPLKFARTQPFREGLAAVDTDNDGRFGFIDKSGKMVIPENIFYPGNFSEGLAAVDVSTCGYIDKTGKQIVPKKYQNCGSFSEGLAKVKLNDKWGFIDKNDTLVIPFNYDETGDFSEGLVVVQQNNKIGFVDNKGTIVIPFVYDTRSKFGELDSKFKDGLAPVAKGSGMGGWGYINRNNQEVIPFNYWTAESFTDGFALVETTASGKFYISSKVFLEKQR